MASGRTSETGALRWAAVTCLIAAAVGTVAYLAGISGAEEEAVGAAPAGTPGLIPLTQVYGAARRGGFADGRRSAYAEGRLDGIEEGRRAERRRLERTRERLEAGAAEEALDGLAEDGWFLVTLGEGGRSIADRAGPLDPALTYALCRDGSAVCSTPRDR
jgi:hypothetical protein